MIFQSFALAVGQLPDARFRSVLLRGIGLTIALLVGVYAAFLGLIDWADQSFLQDAFGGVTWVGDLLGWASLAIMLVLSVFLMVPVASAITSLFLDEVANAVEAKHYPTLPPAAPVPFWDALRDTVNFLGVLIAANIAGLVVYGILIATFILSWAAPAVFVLLNGYLLGREYFQVAAMRRLGRQGAKEMRARHSRTIWLAGCLMTLPLMIPLVNLIIPILGAATFTHLFHHLTRLESTSG